MRTVLTVLLMIASLAGARAQDDILPETEERKAYIMEYLDGLFELDQRTENMVVAMVDLYVQSIVRTAAQIPVSDRTRSIYDKMRDNHIELLGNYLDAEQLDAYLNSLLGTAAEDVGGTETCIYCNFPRKAGRDHCVFCGYHFE